MVEGVSLVVLEEPSTWLLALAGFLLRGGVLVFALPIVALPTAVGLANFIGPTSVTAGGPAGRLIALLLASLAIVGAWLSAALVLGSLLDRAVISRHLQAMGVSASDRVRGRLPDLIVIRLLLFLPLGVVIAWASGRITDAGYQELILPTNLSSPLALRIVLGAGDAVALIGLAWLVCQGLAAMAVRRALIDGGSPGRALRGAVAHLVRHPVSTLSTTILGAGASIGFLAIAVVALSVSWTTLRITLVEGRSAIAALGALAGFLVVWLGALVVAGILAAWRSALWTGEMARFDIARSGDR